VAHRWTSGGPATLVGNVVVKCARIIVAVTVSEGCEVPTWRPCPPSVVSIHHRPFDSGGISLNCPYFGDVYGGSSMLFFLALSVLDNRVATRESLNLDNIIDIQSLSRRISTAISTMPNLPHHGIESHS
jgi:hypothetical protein